MKLTIKKLRDYKVGYDVLPLKKTWMQTMVVYHTDSDDIKN